MRHYFFRDVIWVETGGSLPTEQVQEVQDCDISLHACPPSSPSGFDHEELLGIKVMFLLCVSEPCLQRNIKPKGMQAGNP